MIFSAHRDTPIGEVVDSLEHLCLAAGLPVELPFRFQDDRILIELPTS